MLTAREIGWHELAGWLIVAYLAWLAVYIDWKLYRIFTGRAGMKELNDSIPPTDLGGG